MCPDSDDTQLFIIIDNKVFMETDSYTEGLFALFGVHYVFNLEYPKKLKYVYQFVFPPKKGTVSTAREFQHFLLVLHKYMIFKKFRTHVRAVIKF